MWVLLSFQASCLHQEGAELSPREPWAKDSRIPQALPPTPAPESAVLGCRQHQEPLQRPTGRQPVGAKGPLSHL